LNHLHGFHCNIAAQYETLKTISSIFLLFIILIQTFTSFVYDAAYCLNKNFIAENFCVNKDKPATHCNGHCYLSKQKEKEQDSDKQAPENKKDKVEFSAYELPGEVTAEFNFTEINHCYNESVNALLHGYSSSIFHPPLA